MTKAMIIGLDAATPEMTRRYIGEGRLPNIARLIETGYMAPALPTIPTATSINWTTIATGAWPGTHGIVGMQVHLPGDGHPDHTVTGFDTRLCNAEYLWNAAERGGKTPCLVRYTCSWPPTVTSGLQVDGDGKSWTQTNPNLIAPEAAYSVGKLRAARSLALRPATGWNGLCEGEEALEADLTIAAFAPPGSESDIWPNCPFRHARLMDSGLTLHVLLRKGPSGGYETVTISRTRDLATALDTIRPGQWSQPAYETLRSRHGQHKGGVWFKLIRLSPDGSDLVLFQPEIFPIDGVLTRPESLAAELVELAGPYIDEPGHVAHCFAGWVDVDTYFELLDYQAQWFTKAAEYTLDKYGWDLFMTQVHGLDWSMHVFTGHHGVVVDPDPNLWELMGRNYEIYDRMVGRLMELAGGDTLLTVVSDHGTIDATVDFNPSRLLIEHGLQVREPVAGTVTHGEPGLQVLAPLGEIDWSRTRAYTSHGEIWVNLKGRDPGGIVEPGEPYEQVVNQCIAALYDARDEKTGKRKVSLALTREDARAIGLYGERVGDVVYTVNPEYGGNHGELPNVHYGASSLNALLVMNGPGVKRGVQGKHVWLTDVAPTVAYLSGIPRPRDAEGRVLFEGLERDTW
jgi:predicted AlkP superfamily phosphohydrolase/phosphomutase